METLEMERNKEATCETCPYWDDESGADVTYVINADEFGYCSRFPPVLEDNTRGDEAKYIAVHKECWCGEHPDFIKVPKAPAIPKFGDGRINHGR
jgi:hypothetical protein